MKFDVVTFGSAFHDVYITSDDFNLQKTENGMLLCEEYGEKIVVKDRISTTGGGATNAAVCLERLGVETAIVACVGSGHWGRMVTNQLKEEGVSLLYLQYSRELPTSSSISLVGKDGGRTVLVHRAASNKLSWNHVDWNKLNSNWAYVSSLGGDLNMLSKIVRWSQEKDIKIVFNPGSGEISNRRDVVKYLKQVHMLIMNKHELLKFLGKKTGDEFSKKNVLGLKVEIVVITDGKRGCSVYSQDGSVYKQKAIPSKTIEETGAGDGFGSTFLAGLVKGFGTKKSLFMAAVNAASVVQKIGPKDGLLFWPELSKLLEDNSEK